MKKAPFGTCVSYLEVFGPIVEVAELRSRSFLLANLLQIPWKTRLFAFSLLELKCLQKRQITTDQKSRLCQVEMLEETINADAFHKECHIGKICRKFFIFKTLILSLKSCMLLLERVTRTLNWRRSGRIEEKIVSSRKRFLRQKKRSNFCRFCSPPGQKLSQSWQWNLKLVSAFGRWLPTLN